MNAWLKSGKKSLSLGWSNKGNKEEIPNKISISLDCEACNVLGYYCLCEVNMVLAFIRGNTVHSEAHRTSGDKKNEQD